jgi:predicted small metal-binding protein
MSMRVFECNACGEVQSGADDEELLRRMREHFASAHAGQPFDEERVRETLAREAYSAADS